MKKMKKYFFFPCSLLIAGLLTSCDDFFQPETADALKGDDYMSSLTEMSTGYLGIMTKMQAVGDKEIFLTDTRGELLEPTEQSIAPLIALYNYDDDLTGNEYADPAGYYDVVIACNDYISKMVAFDKERPELVKETEYFEGLLASAIRVKVWAYMTLAEIYGQALWFDDPITSIKDVNDASVFQLMKADKVIEKCVSLLENPFPCNARSIDPKANFSWISWVDPEHANAIDKSSYRYWDQMTPPYNALLVKSKVWDAALQEAKGNTTQAMADYKVVADTILSMFHQTFVGNIVYWKRGARVSANYDKIWNNATPYPEESVSAIIYDFQMNQTNRLLYHFSREYPNKYLLAPSEAGAARYKDTKFANLGTQSEDKRGNSVVKLDGSHRWLGKFRTMYSSARPEAYQDDVHIYTFRAAELYLWLAEALNHLGRYAALDHIINGGFNSDQSDLFIALETGELEGVSEADKFEYEGFTSYWVNSKTGGTFSGFRGCFTLGKVEIWDEKKHTVDEAKRHNDEVIANEWVLECAAEGKVYPNLIRMAERYADPTIVSSRVTPKYEAGLASVVEGKIASVNPYSKVMGYYVPWNLQVK